MGIDFAPFLLISVLLILIPGPDTAIVTKHALLAGRRGGVFASVGVATGLAIWTLAAAVGVAAVLRASEVAFLALKIAGAIYLVWMGIQLLRDRSTLAPGVGGDGAPRRGAAKKALRQGLLSDLSNPKIAVFFTSFLPAVRARRQPRIRIAARARLDLLRADPALAPLLRHARRARLDRAAAARRAACARSVHGRRARGVRHPARVRAPLEQKRRNRASRVVERKLRCVPRTSTTRCADSASAPSPRSTAISIPAPICPSPSRSTGRTGARRSTNTARSCAASSRRASTVSTRATTFAPRSTTSSASPPRASSRAHTKA